MTLPAGLLPAPPTIGEAVVVNLGDYIAGHSQVSGTITTVGPDGLVDVHVAGHDVDAYAVRPYLQHSDGAYWRWLRADQPAR